MRPCLARTVPNGKLPMSQTLKPVSNRWVTHSFRVLAPQAAVALAAVALAVAPEPAPGRVTASALLADLTMTARTTIFAATASVRRRKSDVASPRLRERLTPWLLRAMREA